MKLVSVILSVAAASAVAIVAANAADMYRAPAGVSYKDAPEPMAIWAGPYIGINGGYAWGREETVTGSSLVGIPATATFTPDGWFGGGQVGYNLQRGSLLFGVEADIQGADISGSATAGSTTAETKLDWFGTVRARAGYTVGAALIYGTGGFAAGGVQDSVGAVKHSGTATGYAAGGGLEYKFTPSWSGKAEYQYLDLGSDTVNTVKVDHEYNTVRLGLNYQLRPSYEPLK